MRVLSAVVAFHCNTRFDMGLYLLYPALTCFVWGSFMTSFIFASENSTYVRLISESGFQWAVADTQRFKKKILTNSYFIVVL